MKNAGLPIVAVAAALTLAGCGTTVPGSAFTAPSSSAAASTVPVPSGLDTGDFKTTLQEIGAPSSDKAWVIEGNRMGDALLQVNAIDPRLTIGGAGLRSFPVLRGAQLTDRVPDATASAFNANEMRVGMTTTRGDSFDNPKVAVRIGLYRFESEAKARAAFDEVKGSQSRLRPVPITSVPGVTGAEFKPGTVDSYLVEGAFVINVSGTAPTTDEGAKFVSRAYELELPKLRAFTPTPADKIGTLPGDQDGILSRTVPEEDSDPTTQSLSNSYFDLAQLLHRIRDVSFAGDFADAGVDLVSQGATAVYRTRDNAAAAGLVASNPRRNPGSTPAESPARLPEAKCYRLINASFACNAAVGRWLAVGSGEELALAQQKISAQYVILAQNP